MMVAWRQGSKVHKQISNVCTFGVTCGMKNGLSTHHWLRWLVWGWAASLESRFLTVVSFPKGPCAQIVYTLGLK